MSFLKKVMLVASLFFMSGVANAINSNVGSMNYNVGSMGNPDAKLNVVNFADSATQDLSLSAGFFADNYSFELSQDSMFSQLLDVTYGGFDGLFGFQLLNDLGGIIGQGVTNSLGQVEMGYSFLAAGDYVTRVFGQANNPAAGYVLSMSTSAVSPIPEASTLAMMLGGLGLVGFMARRRKVA